jgi:hypothetical protein
MTTRSSLFIEAGCTQENIVLRISEAIYFSREGWTSAILFGLAKTDLPVGQLGFHASVPDQQRTIASRMLRGVRGTSAARASKAVRCQPCIPLPALFSPSRRITLPLVRIGPDLLTETDGLFGPRLHFQEQS